MRVFYDSTGVDITVFTVVLVTPYQVQHYMYVITYSPIYLFQNLRIHAGMWLYTHMYTDVFPVDSCVNSILDVILCVWYGHCMYAWLQVYIEVVAFFTHPEGNTIPRGNGWQHWGQLSFTVGQPANQVETAIAYTWWAEGFLKRVAGMTPKIWISASFVNIISCCRPTVSVQCRLSNVDCLPAINNDIRETNKTLNAK